jgi:hypothetical protein
MNQGGRLATSIAKRISPEMPSPHPIPPLVITSLVCRLAFAVIAAALAVFLRRFLFEFNSLILVILAISRIAFPKIRTSPSGTR